MNAILGIKPITGHMRVLKLTDICVAIHNRVIVPCLYPNQSSELASSGLGDPEPVALGDLRVRSPEMKDGEDDTRYWRTYSYYRSTYGRIMDWSSAALEHPLYIEKICYFMNIVLTVPSMLLSTISDTVICM